MIKVISSFISRNHAKIIITVIVMVAALLRLYKIADYMTFLGDEGRDALAVKGILEGHFTFLGPRASAGDFYLGPIYYYLIAPFLWLFRYDPVGPAVMIALLGVLTVFLVYKVSKEFFGAKAGLFAACLYAVSPLVIAYSRSSWNPNPLPFFSLLMLYLLYKGISLKSGKLFIIVGILLGITLQLHYLAVFLGVIIFSYVLLGEIYRDKTIKFVLLFKNYIQLAAGFIIGFSPFLLFEVRHGFPNIRTILSFIFSQNLPSKYEVHNSFTAVVQDVFFRLFARLLTRFPPPEQVNIDAEINLRLLWLGTIVLALISIFILAKHKQKIQVLLLLLWLILGVSLFGFYKRQIYDYYLAFMFPLPFLLTGNFIASLMNIRKIRWVGVILGLSIFTFLLIYNLQGMPFKYPPNKQKEQVKKIAEFVLSQTDNKPFNFALITGGNSDHSYRYFMELEGRKPVAIENPAVDLQRRTVTDQLLIICEMANCQPLGHPLWEIAGFGQAEIAGEWDLTYVKVYKLERYKGK